MRDKETRNGSDLEVRDLGEDRMRVEGYAAVFGAMSDDLGGFRERIARGAFNKTLTEQRNVFLFDGHDPSKPLASTGSGTLELTADDHGLRAAADLSPTTYARDLAVNVRSGLIGKMSFGFRKVDDAWETAEDGTNVRTLREVRLYEVSIVAQPAYADTAVAMRSLEAVLAQATPPDFDELRRRQLAWMARRAV